MAATFCKRTARIITVIRSLIVQFAFTRSDRLVNCWIMVAYGSHSKLESEHSRCEIICTPARVVDSVHLMVQSVDTCLIL